MFKWVVVYQGESDICLYDDFFSCDTVTVAIQQHFCQLFIKIQCFISPYNDDIVQEIKHLSNSFNENNKNDMLVQSWNNHV